VWTWDAPGICLESSLAEPNDDGSTSALMPPPSALALPPAFGPAAVAWAAAAMQETDKVYVVGHGDEQKQNLGGEQPETLACKLKEGVQNSKQVNLVMCGTSDLALARRFALRLFREGYAGTVYAYRSWLTINEEGKMFGRKIYNDLEGVSPEVAKSLEKGKRVPANEVVATFDRESFAEEFAADKEGDQSLLSFLHGGESDHKVAASDDDGKTDHGSLLEK
jgi:hypothetical protein